MGKASFDIAIVGLGAVGSAALLAAARNGARVVGFDSFHPPHGHGSTHGETRIVRAAIGEGVAYTPFALRSFALMDQLSSETGETLWAQCGLLYLGGLLPHATHAPVGFLDSTLAAAKTFNIPHEMLTATEVRQRFPAYAGYDGARAYFEPGAGMAYPERVVAAQLARARALGAEVYLNTPVVAIDRGGIGATVRTEWETINAGRVVLAVGAWTSSFLPPGIAGRLSVTRQALHWFEPPSNPFDFEPQRMPAFIWNDLYGFPIATDGVKIATETLHAVTHPNRVRREIGLDDFHAIVPRVRAAFPALGPHLRGETCLYTATPDFNFWIAPHPEIEHVTVLSTCSGHGFKHAPALGEAVIGEILSFAATPIPGSWRTLKAPSLPNQPHS